MSEITCPSCGQRAAGQFCSHCGASLAAGSCASCGGAVPAGARFCPQCGVAVGAAATAAAAPAGRGSWLPWAVTAVALIVLAAIFLVPRYQEEAAVSQQAAAMGGGMGGIPTPPAGQGPSAIDLTSMDPREAADRLFNRVMQAREAGDTAQVMTFLPMALSAYQSIPSLDHDGRYHLGTLQLVAGNLPAARAQADTLLAANPNHLLGLAIAAEAEQTQGNLAQARSFYQRYLQAYPAESPRQVQEYLDHARSLESHLERARQAAGGQ